MAASQTNPVIEHLRRAVLLHDGAGLTDGQLLEDYLRHREEAALTALVRRHAPMVWGVCRRVLHDHHDAEDAFQATFLVLVRKASSIAAPELLASWLYGVARQTALKARATLARRRTRERQVMDMPEPAMTQQDLWHDLQPLLDHELSRLPEKYRVAIILCDIEGKARKEAARQLGVPDGTLAARLARGRVMLARRLARHGLAVSGGSLAAVLAQNAASASAPAPVVVSTIQATAAGVISTRVAALTEGVLKAMLLDRFKGVLVALVVVVAALVAGSGYLLPSHAGEKPPELTIPLKEPEASKASKADFNKTILAMEARFWKAAMKFDAEAMKDLYADDFTAVSERGRSNKAANVEATRQYRSANVRFRSVEIIRLNDDAAIVTYRMDQDVFARDGSLIRRQRDCRVSNAWARREGRWVFVFSQQTQMP
jgi:RNA polymerase sigma factor (sigma-70 family)